MYLPVDLNKYWAVDVEGDNLPSTKVWCAVFVNCATAERHSFTDYAEIKAFVQARKSEGCKFVGHNIIGYDAPTLNRLVGTKLTVRDIVDTMLLSMVYSPSFSGGHSLENWGGKLGMPKGEFSDFSRYSDEMLKYCIQDTLICREIFRRIVVRMRAVGFSEEGIELEHLAWVLIKKQQETGFKFNAEEAEILYSKLRAIEAELQEKIYVYWPPERKPVHTFVRPYKKDGTPSANYTKHLTQYPLLVVSDDRGSYTAYDDVYFNIGSPPQRIQKLLELGWEPREFTKPSKTHPNGQPKATDKGKLTPSLQEFVDKSGKEEVRLIAEWIEINARANMVNTWLEAYNPDTGCIHGSLWLANTLRYRHSNPNTANIPRASDKRGLEGKFTYEARALWTVRDPANRVLVGVDAKGIQLRVLAHYLNNEKFTDVVINGDPHSHNQEIGGFETRDVAKTFIYAFFLGAGDAKIGQIIGGSARDGKQLKRRFIDSTPGLKHLLADLKRQVERTGRIKLCDGTPVIVDKPHTVLAYLLQGDESRIMKRAMVLTAKENARRKLDVLKVGDIHDEWQNDTLKTHADEFANDVCPHSFEQAGKAFNYIVPISCSAHIGMTWAETH